MGTDVTYGPVVLKNVRTREWTEEWIYDESDTDAIYAKYYLEFDGIVHWNNSFSFSPGSGPSASAPTWIYSGVGATPTEIYEAIRACLHEPRQLLIVTFGGETVLRALHVNAGTDVDCDVRNGPKPRLVKLTHIANNTVFHVTFGIEVCKLECCTFNVDTGTFEVSETPANLVLSNRWSVTESMDESFFSTRVIRGRMVCSQAMAENLHSLRPMIIPTLEPGFKRAGLEFAVLPNGLECEYSVVDRQVHTSAPYPATKMSAVFTESNDQNTALFSEMRVKMEGGPNSDKCAMMTRAVQVAAARLGDPATWYPINDPTKTSTFIEQIVLQEMIGEENSVEFTARLRRAPPVGSSAFIGNLPALAVNSNFGAPLKLPGTPSNYDPAQSPVPNAYGYTPYSTDPRDPSDNQNPAIVLYLCSCYLQSPCVNDHALAQLVTSNLYQGPKAQEDSDPEKPYVSSSTVSQLQAWTPAASSILSAVTPGTLYLFATMTSEIKVRRLKAGLPVAGDIFDLSSDSVAVVSLGRPQAMREIHYDAERVGAMPELPPPLEEFVDGGITFTLIDHRITNYPSTASVDGVNRVFRAQGYYLYLLSRPPLEGESLLVGRLPFMGTSQSTERFDTSSYNPTLGPGAGSGTPEEE